MNLPDIFTTDTDLSSVYVASTPADPVRILCLVHRGKVDYVTVLASGKGVLASWSVR